MTEWSDLLGSPDEGKGTWVQLPGNGWGALVAYLAGPGRVRATKREPSRVRTVQVIGDVEVSWMEDSSDEDLAIQDRYVESYLVEHAVPAAPPGLSFEIRIPIDASWDDVVSRLNVAVMTQAANGDPLAEREAMRGVLDELFGE